MSKTTNMLLFFLAATVFNIALMVILIFLFIVVAGLVSNSNPTVYQIILFVGFLASIVLTFLIYGWVMKKVVVKLNLEKHIPQLFKKKR